MFQGQGLYRGTRGAERGWRGKSSEELGNSSVTCPLLMKEIEGAHKHPAQKNGYKLVFWHVL